MKLSPYTGRTLWAFDTETWLIQPGLLAPPLVCGSYARSKCFGGDCGWPCSQCGSEYGGRCDPGCKGVDTCDCPKEGILDKAQTRREFREVLESQRILVGHNLAYDFGVMCADDPTLVPLVFAKLERDECFDTMVAEQLIQIHEGTLGQTTSGSGGGLSLEDLGRKYLGSDRKSEKSGPDAWRLRYAELDGIPLEQWPEAAVAYPIRDARETYDIAAAQIALDQAARERGEEGGRNLHDLPAQLRAHWVLHLSGMWGIRTDKPWVDEFTAKVTKEHSRSRAEFLAAGLLKVRRCVKKDGVLETPDEIDADALEDAIKDAAERISPKESDLGKTLQKRLTGLEKALKDFDAGKPQRYGTDKKALEERVVDAYQGDPPLSAKGNIRCNKDTLWEAGSDLLEAFADAQDNEKFFSTYLKVLAQGTEVPINARINLLLLTGRTSMSKPNLQNLPRGSEAGRPREAFVAREGCVFASLDYPTLELRTLAYALEYFGFRSHMADALREGQDLHARLAAQIKGCTYAEFMDALHRKEQWAKDFRQMAKAANFGLPGGLGAVKLVAYARQSYDARFCLLSGEATVCGVEKVFDKRSRTTVCKACLGVAKKLKDTWFETWPEMNSETGYFALVNEWTQREVIEILDEDGQPEEMNVGSVLQILSERVRGCCNFTNGANTIFQGLAADIAKRSLWLVGKEMYCDPASPLWGHRLLVFVHDEQFNELQVKGAAAAAERAARLMEQAFAEYCGPDAPHSKEKGLLGIPCTVEPALAFRWYKDADTQRDAAGNVVPVEKCPTCKKLAPVGWDGLVLKHEIKIDGVTQVCAGVGKPNPVAVARGFGVTGGLADTKRIG